MSKFVRSDHAGLDAARIAARCGLSALLLATASLESAPAHGKCSIERLPPMHVTMVGGLPLIDAEINGNDALFVADSGSFFSIVTPAAAHQFDMTADPSQETKMVLGNAVQITHVAWAKSFTIMGQKLSKVPFYVVDIPLVHAAGLLGQTFFRIDDVEYDLANGVIRLVRAKECKGSPLAYWAEAAGKPYSDMDIELATADAPYTRGVAYLNDTKINVTFRTANSRSVLTLAAAKRAGITPESEGVRPGNYPGTWIARFASFRIGDETIEHAQLRFGDVEMAGTDMVIGADFFLSHRIYVASSQRKLYFTYNGGPVFDLNAQRAAASADSGSAAASSSSAAPAEARAMPVAPPPADKRLDEPTDAAGFSRRALASAARHDLAAAIADLDRACELAPSEAVYRYQRGFLHWQSRQPDLALADFDKAIDIKPGDVDSHIMRASIRWWRHDTASATQDLEAADRAAPKDSDARPSIARVYESLGNLPAAREQVSMWIDTHPSDPRMPEILNSRCWYGGLTGDGLEQALADCNLALKLRPKFAQVLDSRGLVHLRRGEVDQAIADYDAALRIAPKMAWSLYGRGLAKLRKGQSADGHADLQAAAVLDPKIGTRAAKFGLTP